MNRRKEYHLEIIALETPKVINHCHKCKETTEFYCSEKFRVNAQQKRIDVWLIYKCEHCDSTWNYTILSRVLTHSLDQDLHQKFMNNDCETAWSYAFQIGELKKMCKGVNTDIKYTIKSEPLNLEDGIVTMHFFSKYQWELRIDKILKEILCVSRSKLNQMLECGNILLDPGITMNSKLKGDLQVTIMNHC